MGCCISSTKKNSQQQVPVIETVKEVLSETHIAIPQPPPPPPLPPPPLVAEPEAHFPGKQKKLEKEVRKEEEIRTPEVSLSQASEICSVSETTISTATTVSTAGREIVKGEEEVMSKRRSNLRSPGGKVNARKKLNAPADRGRAGIGQRPGPAASRTMASGGGGVIRRGDGVGERSGRRSRSPATRAASGVGRGRGGGSPGKLTGKGGGRSVGVGGGGSTSSGSSGVKKEEKNDSVLMERQEAEEEEEGERANSEALGDNPLVSLECFIFL